MVIIWHHVAHFFIYFFFLVVYIIGKYECIKKSSKQVFDKQDIPVLHFLPNPNANRIPPLKFNLELFPIINVAKRRHRKRQRKIMFHKSDVQP